MAGPSLLQVHAEKVHREHPRFDYHHHHHGHIHSHKREKTVSLIVDVVETISVIDFVDPDGHTLTVQTIFPPGISTSALLPAVPTPSDLLSVVATPTASPSPALTSDNIPPTLPPTAISSPTDVGLLTSSGTSATDAGSVASSSTPATDTAIIPLSTDASQVSSSLSSLSQTAQNSLATIPLTSAIAASINPSSARSSDLPVSAFAPSSSLLSPLTSSASTTSFNSSTTFSSSTITPAASSPLILSSGTVVGGVSATYTTSGVGTPSSTVDAGGFNGTSNTGTTPSTPVLVGSVVGSVAGVALIIAALLFILRWKRQQRHADGTRPKALGGGSSQPMAQQSFPFALPAALATFAGRKRNTVASNTASMTASSTAGSERGFYRVSGRKIQSVLESGGDGYGGGPSGSHDQDNFSGSTFNRDSAGTYGGTGSSPLPPPVDRTQYEGVLPVIRSSPTRTPVTSQRSLTQTVEPPALLPSSPWSDGVGRSLPSHDGSHTSRFTEEV